MPGAPRNAWGVWGAPEPIKPWEHGAPKLHSEIGGSVRPQFADTLQWFYGRALNPKDKEHCVRLLAQIQLKKEDSKKSNLAVHSQSFKTPSYQSKRPYSAKNQTAARPPTKLHQSRPRSAIPVQSTANDEKIKSSYQLQKESVNRLSRPKSAKPFVQVKESFRPKSAMATVGGRKSFNDPYLTTHEREYQGYPSGLYAEANRPMSSNNVYTFPYELSGPVGNTMASKEFGWKKTGKAEPIRSGTSSGNRRNNPHPHESFMVWKLPKESATGMVTKPAPHLQYRSLTKDVLGEILSEQLKSTYQNDYIGIPQGYQMKTAIDAPPDWKRKMRRSLVTTERCTYKKPEPAQELVGSVTRYGSNKNKGVPALGAVPTVTSSHVKNQEVVKGRTTYEVQFRDRYEQPDLEKLLQNQPNKKAYERFMKYARAEMNKRSVGARPGSIDAGKGPSWVTKWEGPHHHEHQ